VIVGAGVIGLCAAYELRKRGEEVVVLDKGQPGMGSSFGNAGWVTPGLSEPLPAPGLVWTSMRWMLDPASPLYIKPRFDPLFMEWMWRFYRNCSPAQYEAGVNALVSLAQPTWRLFDQLAAEGLRFEMHEAGLLYLGLEERRRPAADRARRAARPRPGHQFGRGRRRPAAARAPHSPRSALRRAGGPDRGTGR
jgi:D-amino-acid dehydrogenase